MKESIDELHNFFDILQENVTKLTKDRDSSSLIQIIEFRKTINIESDRGCALMAAAFLDEQLIKLLESYFVDDTTINKRLLGSSGVLGSFSARIDMAFSLGLIAKNIMTDLTLLRRIRNDFAHFSAPITFGSDSIVSRCLELKSAFVPKSLSPRARFCRSMITIATQIELTKHSLKRIEAMPDYDDIHVRSEQDKFIHFVKNKFSLDLSEKI